jgi:DNA-binding NarL/FixJ family response regulator
MIRRRTLYIASTREYFTLPLLQLMNGYIQCEMIVVNNENELWEKINRAGERIVFLERFFANVGTPDVIEKLAEQKVKVIVFSLAPMVSNVVVSLAEHGARGYFDFRDETITVETVKKAIECDYCFPDSVSGLLESIEYNKQYGHIKEFKPLDKKILRFTAMGMTVKEIANKCNCTEIYIKKRKSRMYKMTNTDNIFDLINIAFMMGIIVRAEFENFREKKYRGVLNAFKNEERKREGGDGKRLIAFSAV